MSSAPKPPQGEPFAEGQARMRKVSEQLRELITTLEVGQRDVRPAPAAAPPSSEPASRELELQQLRQRCLEIEAENQRSGTLLAEAERQYADVCRQLAVVSGIHLSLGLPAVLASLQEIVANFLGCEDGAILVREPGTLQFPMGLAFGPTAAGFGTVVGGKGLIGKSVVEGRPYVAPRAGRPAGIEGEITACFPMLRDGEPVGVIVLFHLLRQKPVLLPEDLALGELLALHGAIALHAARRG